MVQPGKYKPYDYIYKGDKALAEGQQGCRKAKWEVSDWKQPLGGTITSVLSK